MSNLFSSRLREIENRIGEAARRSGRDASAVTLVAVTKTHPVEALREAYDAGLRDFGENRVQEALSKIPALPSDIRWHLIGQLQTNKINKTAGIFHMIHSVDSVRLGEAMSRRFSGEPQDILLEVNTSGEASKSGVESGATIQAARELLSFPNLRLRGLMTVGPLTDEPARQRDAFRRLKGLFEELRASAENAPRLDVLSMGMSADFESAIEEGSTLVRVGTALFGSRGHAVVA